MVDFKKYGGRKRVVDVADPLKLFESLDVKTSHTTLRPAQIEAIQALAARRSERDHVLKMNTGAGKTTVALLYLRCIRSANRVADGAALGCEAGGRCQSGWPSEIWRKGLSARSC
jgi:type I site-specific restriction endonuclease